MKKRRRTGNGYTALLVASVVIVLAVIMLLPKGSDIYIHTASPTAVMLREVPAKPISKLAPSDVSMILDSELYSGYAYLCDAENGSVIAEKSCEERTYPASLTKIMTTLVLLENSDDLYAEVTVSSKMYDKLYRAGASMAGFQAGEKTRLYDLLCGIMLPSGAEAAVAAAEFVFGSEEKLVSAMNAKALEMGLANTHFANITGLHDDGHYTNAAEMAQILSAALENEVFREISSKKSHLVPPTNKHPKGFTMKSTVFSKLGGRQPDELEIIGGKTGFTYEAGLCLATYAELDGKCYIAVTMGVEGNHKTPQYQVDDAIFLFDIAA